MIDVKLTWLDRLTPPEGWTWQDVEDIIFTGMRAINKLPDREQRFLRAGGKVNWPEIRQEFSDRVNALNAATSDKDIVKALTGRFTIKGYRGGVSQAEIDMIEPAFDLIMLIPEKDLRFFQAVMFSKIFHAGRASWAQVREDLNISHQVQQDSMSKRYRRILMALAERVDCRQGGEW